MIILTGVAGAGKSMQGRYLADEAGYPWLSTGELLRVLITGKRRQEMLEGKLLSDEEVIKVFNTVVNLIDINKEFVVDGFPRTINQTEWLIEQVHSGRFELTSVFNLVATEEVVRGRLEKRGRQDDNDKAINKRFEEYNKVTLPLLDHFDKENIKIINIDASLPPHEVHKIIMDELASIKPNSQ
ncbi:MAG: nucleoside monophosphate kinase [bacterium]|jgi:adenylate kinase